jgi:putative membrane protein
MFVLFRWLINSLALLLIANYFPGIEVGSFYSALVIALVLGIVNAVIRPILIILTLPLNIVTLGLFTFVINGLLFWFVSTVVKGFEVADFWAAFWGALAMTLVSWMVSWLLKK